MRKRIFPSEKQHSRSQNKKTTQWTAPSKAQLHLSLSLSLISLQSCRGSCRPSLCLFIGLHLHAESDSNTCSLCIFLSSSNFLTPNSRLNTRVSISLSPSLILHLHTFVAIYNIRRVKEQMGSLLTKSISKEQLEMAVSKVKTIVTSNPVVVFRFFYCSF